MLTPLALETYWVEQYPDCPPIGYWLRDVYRDRWVRFHSLPHAKRYAEDSAEMQIILDRQNAILQHLAQPTQSLILISTGYSDSSIPVRNDPHLLQLDPQARGWRSLAKHELDSEAEPNYWYLYGSEWMWQLGIFDPILRLVADWAIANIMILSTHQGWIFHPYDGGVDVILATTDERNQLKAQFSSWLSARTDGL